ncbi:MAG: hypothetical protein A2Y09_07540 [Planctomycetes bacterium GWA2_39_15]|nr:MAG: hypothetical protein A2Y09_07540 [Planctomycetes bacterium GWA2_39_15]
MNNKMSLISLIFSFFVTGVILFFVIKPSTLFYEVQLVIDNQKGVNFSNKNWVIPPDSDGIVNFNLMGTVENKHVKQCNFEISPNEEGKWYLQMGGYSVVDNMFIGKAQLGSKEYPMKKDQYYGFRLTQDNGSLLAQGTIIAKVYKLYGTSSQLLISISLFASILQIILVVLSLRTEK